MHDVPCRKSQRQSICLTAKEIAYIQSFAQGDEISLADYIKACTHVLNARQNRATQEG